MNTPISDTELKQFFQPYMDQYNWSLVTRSSGKQSIIDHMDTYDYSFIDDAGIMITLNPNNKGFRFMKIVGFLFKLTSDEFTPWDFKDHFEKNYMRFRNIVISKDLN